MARSKSKHKGKVVSLVRFAPAPQTVRAPAKATAYGRVRDQLRDDILSGHYLPGQRLTPNDLASRYETSSMPIRVALQELQGEGLVTIEPRRGAWVRRVDEEFITNIYELRIAVLALLYPKCVRYITNADIEEIEAIQDVLDHATKVDDLPAIRFQNYLFHMRVYRIARNPEAFDVMERTWVLVNALRAKFGFGPGRLDDANQNHREIIVALRARDARTAVDLGQASAERARLDLIALVTRQAQQPQRARAGRK
jgi:DNA-binding GntR family transcriptional regulator